MNRKLSKLLKRVASGIAAGAMAFSMIGGYLPNSLFNTTPASAAKYVKYSLTAGDIIKQACTFKYRDYYMGGKGNGALDCSGFVYQTLGSLGVSATNYNGNDNESSYTLPENTYDWYNHEYYEWDGILKYRDSTIDCKSGNVRAYSESDWNAWNGGTIAQKVAAQSYWDNRNGGTIPVGSVVIGRHPTNRVYDHMWIYLGEYDNVEDLKVYLKGIGVNLTGLQFFTNGKMADGTKSTHWRIECVDCTIDSYAKDSSGATMPSSYTENTKIGVIIDNYVTGKEAQSVNLAAYKMVEEDTLYIRKFIEGTQLTSGQKGYTTFTVKDNNTGLYMTVKKDPNHNKDNDHEYIFMGWVSANSDGSIPTAAVLNNNEYSENRWGVKINNIPHDNYSLNIAETVTDDGSTAGITSSPVNYRCYYYTSAAPKWGTHDTGSWTSGKTIKSVKFDYTKSNGDTIVADFNNEYNVTDTLRIYKYIDGDQVTATSAAYTTYKVYDATNKKYLQASKTGSGTDQEYSYTGWTSDSSKATTFENRQYSDGYYGVKINDIPANKGYKLQVTETVTAKGVAAGVKSSPISVRTYYRYSKTGTSNSVPAWGTTNASDAWTSGKKITGVKFRTGIKNSSGATIGDDVVVAFNNPAAKNTLRILKYIDGTVSSSSQAGYTYFYVQRGNGQYMTATLGGAATDREYTYTGWTDNKSKATKFNNVQYSSGNYGVKINDIPRNGYHLKVTEVVTTAGKTAGIDNSPKSVRVYYRYRGDGSSNATSVISAPTWGELYTGSWSTGDDYIDTIDFRDSMSLTNSSGNAIGDDISVHFDDPKVTLNLNIRKYIKNGDGTYTNISNSAYGLTGPANICTNNTNGIYFTVKNSSGQFLNFTKDTTRPNWWKYTGTSATATNLTLDRADTNGNSEVRLEGIPYSMKTLKVTENMGANGTTYLSATPVNVAVGATSQTHSWTSPDSSTPKVVTATYDYNNRTKWVDYADKENSQTLFLRKYVEDSTGKKQNITSSNYSADASKLSFTIRGNVGGDCYVVAAKSSDGVYTFKNWTTNASQATKFAITPPRKNSSGTYWNESSITGIPRVGYPLVVTETVATGSKLESAPIYYRTGIMSDLGDSSWKSASGNAVSINYAAATLAVDFDNPVKSQDLTIYKYIDEYSHNTAGTGRLRGNFNISDATENAAVTTVSDHIDVVVVNSKGKYVKVNKVSNNYVFNGFSDTPETFKFLYSGTNEPLKILITGLPADTYRVMEQYDSTANKISPKPYTYKVVYADNATNADRGLLSSTSSTYTNSGAPVTLVDNDAYVGLLDTTSSFIRIQKTIKVGDQYIPITKADFPNYNSKLRLYISQVPPWAMGAANRYMNITGSNGKYSSNGALVTKDSTTAMQFNANGEIEIALDSNIGNTNYYLYEELSDGSSTVTENGTVMALTVDNSKYSLLKRDSNGAYTNSTTTYNNRPVPAIKYGSESNVSEVYKLANPGPDIQTFSKYTIDLDGNKEIASYENDPQLNETARFNIYTSNGAVAIFKPMYDENGEFVAYKHYQNTPGQYVSSVLEANPTAVTSLPLDKDGNIKIAGLPAGSYRVSESFVEDTTGKYIHKSKDKYRTSVTSVTYDGESALNVEMVNPIINRPLEFRKFVNLTDIAGNSWRLPASTAPINFLVPGETSTLETVNSGLTFYIKNEAGEYYTFDEEGNYTGAVEAVSDAERPDETNLKLDATGRIYVNDLPDEKFTICEEASPEIAEFFAVMNHTDVESVTTQYWDVAQNKLVGDVTIAEMDNEPAKGYVKIQKEVLTSTGYSDDSNDFSGISFRVAGTSELGIPVDVTFTTDETGLAVSPAIPVGTYNLYEPVYKDGQVADLDTIPRTVTINKGEIADAGTYEFTNLKTRIELEKRDSYIKDDPVSGAEFAVYKDVNENGTYEAAVDLPATRTTGYDNSAGIIAASMVEEGNTGIYSIEGLPLGKYLVKEVKGPTVNGVKYKVDPNYYPVTLDKDNLTSRVSNWKEFFLDEDVPCKITLTKRIPVEELGGRIWFEHGTPSFVLELKQEKTGRVYRHSYTFTEEYVASHTFTENGKKYVEMSYTWEDMYPGDYVATERKTVRYTLTDIINIEHGVKNETRMSADLHVESEQEGKATFYNVKNTYKDLTHTSIAVNTFKR